MSKQEPATQKDNRLSVLVDNPEYKHRIRELMGERAPQFISSMLSIGKALGDVEPRSLIAAAVTAATLDLPINPNLGFAYLVPYRAGDGPKIAQFQMGYKGYVQLAMRTGQYRFINACVIYEGELVKYDKLTGELRLDETKKESDKVLGYASYFRTLNGFEHAIYMTRKQCDAHAKRYSQSYRKGYSSVWKDDFDAMALKTVIKLNLSKWGVLSIQMEKALFEDQAVRHDLHAEAFYPDGNETIAGPIGLPAITQAEGGAPTGEKSANPKGKGGRKSQPDAPTPPEAMFGKSRMQKSVAETPEQGAAPQQPSAEVETLDALRIKLKARGYEESELVQVAIANNWCETMAKTLDEINSDAIKVFIDNWDDTVLELNGQREAKAKKEGGPFRS